MISLDRVNKLNRLFTANKWHLTGPGAEELFDRFCKIAILLNSEEFDLFYELAKKFKKIYMDNYPLHCRIALEKIDNSLIKECDEIHLLPIIKPTDEKRGIQKSAAAMLYPLLRGLIPDDPKFHGKRVNAYNNAADHRSRKDQKKKNLIIFIDDFIGTGDTFRDFFRAYLKICPPSPNDKYICVCIVAQETGIRTISEIGVSVYCSIAIDRGISDDKALSEQGAILVMQQLEERLNVPQDYRMGYKKSEALVSLIRTPNNTFPIFWRNGKLDGKDWPAPFPR